jgi:hypothetical protein
VLKVSYNTLPAMPFIINSMLTPFHVKENLLYEYNTFNSVDVYLISSGYYLVDSVICFIFQTEVFNFIVIHLIFYCNKLNSDKDRLINTY